MIIWRRKLWEQNSKQKTSQIRRKDQKGKPGVERFTEYGLKDD